MSAAQPGLVQPSMRSSHGHKCCAHAQFPCAEIVTPDGRARLTGDGARRPVNALYSARSVPGSPPTHLMVGCGWCGVRAPDVGGRTVTRLGRHDQSLADTHTVNMEPDTVMTPEDTASDLKCKYKLRKKLEDARGGDSGPKKRGPKPRLRSAGMSRYRRKEANARERQRQGEINTSFDKLREKIPPPPPTNGKCEKLRKIDILHVAINYIR